MALICESFIGLGRGDVERDGVEYRGLAVVWVGGLQFTHFLFERSRVPGVVLVVFHVISSERFDVGFFAGANPKATAREKAYIEALAAYYVEDDKDNAWHSRA